MNFIKALSEVMQELFPISAGWVAGQVHAYVASRNVVPNTKSIIHNRGKPSN